MKIIPYPKPEQWSALASRPLLCSENLNSRVNSILKKVKRDGDSAVLQYTKDLDGVALESLLVSDTEFQTAQQLVSAPLKEAMKLAAGNIRRFHLSQKESIKYVETVKGVTCWRRSVGIERVGLYVPGGSAPLFSTVLMLGIPAAIAGCKEVQLCTPPGKDGKINPAILVAAKLAGIRRVYKVGGAQAIAAMAYGTQSISKSDKIFGPGNQYVTCAKQLVSIDGTAIDLPAGPSELAVFADKEANASFVAADLLSQAEHGADSQVILTSTSLLLIEDVIKELNAQIRVLPRKAIARKALENSRFILFRTSAEAIEFLNLYAPEHLILSCRNARTLSKRVSHAGSVFIGPYSAESTGDYASGTNHTLPTNGYARAYSGVSLESFLKKITFQEVSAAGLLRIGPSVEIMAEAEQLEAHKNAISIRLNTLKS
ncbi:MAG: histidinol dehydrogenase [Bacteroidetes bacterium]|nr:histidinol dehydrogenase [Bacteroidota bacterium]